MLEVKTSRSAAFCMQKQVSYHTKQSSNTATDIYEKQHTQQHTRTGGRAQEPRRTVHSQRGSQAARKYNRTHSAEEPGRHDNGSNWGHARERCRHRQYWGRDGHMRRRGGYVTATDSRQIRRRSDLAAVPSPRVRCSRRGVPAHALLAEGLPWVLLCAT